MVDHEIFNSNSVDWKRLKELFVTHGIQKTYSRKDFLCRLGDKPTHFVFIEKGGFKHICIDSAGKERIITFHFEGEFLGGYIASRCNCNLLMNIQAIEDSVVYELSYSEFNEALKVYFPNTHDFRLKVAEIIALECQQKLLSVCCETPGERYQKLIKHAPDIINRVSLREISSYLGITPETLSRMRTRMLK